MPVVINEFEAEPRPQRSNTEAQPEEGGEPGSSPEHEVARVMELQASRGERIRAY